MKVKVVNDNKFPYSEKYRGNMINIPAKGHIEMDINEASDFMGTNPGTAQVDANNIPKPESYKMLRIEKIGAPQAVAAEPTYVCMADGREFHSQKELDAYIEANHLDSLVDEDAKEKIVAKNKGGRPRKLKDVTNDTGNHRDGGQTKV